jgi:hypothetical protein
VLIWDDILNLFLRKSPPEYTGLLKEFQ